MSQMEMFADVVRTENEIIRVMDTIRDWDANKRFYRPESTAKKAKNALLAAWRNQAKSFNYL